MPVYKHPCPHCGKYIARDIATCPFCGTSDPFKPRPQSAAPEPQPRPAAKQPAAGKCTGCGAPLAEGARFCTVCGTLAP
jgi:hypothetical protein